MIPRLFASRIGIRLAFLLAIVVAVCTGLLAWVSMELIRDFGRYSVEQNRAGILAQAEKHALREARDEAATSAMAFVSAEEHVRFMASRASYLLAHPRRFGGWSHTGKESFSLERNKSIWTNSPDSLTSAAYWGNATMSGSARKRMNALSHADPDLMHAMDAVPGAKAAWFIMADGSARYYPNIHLVDRMPSVHEFDFRNDICFLIATPERNPDRSTTWTNVYQDSVGQGLMITANAPVYDQSGRFLGSAGIDISLDNMLSSVLDNEGMGFRFVLDKQSGIVGFPPDLLDLVGIDPKILESLEPGRLLGKHLSNSTIPSVRALAGNMTRGGNGLITLMLDGTSWMVAYAPVNPTGWSLGVAVPQSELLASVKLTQSAGQDTIQAMRKSFLVIAGLFGVMLLAVSLAFISIRLLTPLQEVLSVIGRISSGDLHARATARQNDEMGELGRAVNRMAERLQSQRESLEKAEHQYRSIFENAQEGIFRVTVNGRPMALNRSVASILGYATQKEAMETISNVTTQVYAAPNERSLMLEKLENNGEISGHLVRFKRKDGSLIWVELFIHLVRGEDGEPLYTEGFLMDVSARVEAERIREDLSRQFLKAQEEERTRLAMELHDSVGQDLQALRIRLSSPPPNEEGKGSSHGQDSLDILKNAIDSLRDLAYELRPATLSTMGLVRSLEGWLKSLHEETELRVAFSSAGLENTVLDSEAEIHIFRVVQEAVNNAMRHASPTEITVRMVASHPWLIIRIEDDGLGFDVQARLKESSATKHMGLWSMEKRVRLLEGSLDISSRPLMGTRIKASLPMDSITGE